MDIRLDNPDIFCIYCSIPPDARYVKPDVWLLKRPDIRLNMQLGTYL